MGRHSLPETPVRPLYGLLTLVIGAALVVMGVWYAPVRALALLAVGAGGACLAAALYEFTGE